MTTHIYENLAVLLRTCVPTFRTHVRSDSSETYLIQPFPLGEPTALCRPQGWKCHSGLLHFRRSAFSSPQTAGVRLCESFLCGESTSPTGDV